MKKGIIAALVLGLLTTVVTAMMPLITFMGLLGQSPDTSDKAADPGRVPGLSPVLLDAYVQAAKAAPEECKGMRWQILAGVAQIESGQASGSVVAESGDVRPKIIGPALDGSGAGGNTTGFPDTDGGKWDDDTTWDRAVGVLQFIPTSWEHFTTDPYDGDGNDDGIADPHNAYDNARAAMNHLCAAADDFTQQKTLRAALFDYNQSHAYVDKVATAVESYDQHGATDDESGSANGGEVGDSGPCTVDDDLPRKNPNSCEKAIDKAIAMTNQDCAWAQLCLGFTAVAYGWNVSGEFSAYTHWQQLDAAGLTHPGDRNPPPGALVYWKGDGPYGHIAITVGGGKIASNDIVRTGCIDIVDWDAPETQWGQNYLGWAPPAFPDGG